MLTYSFHDIGSDSLYEHLYKCMKNDIMGGVLKPDERLPSKRSFSKHLNISTITIENAYNQLLVEGYIYSIPKKGYYVSNLIGLTNRPNEKPTETIKENPIKSAYFADFVSNQTNPDNFPFSIWAKLMREVMMENSRDLMTKSPGVGIRELRTSISDYLKQFRGMSVSPEQIVIGAGTEYLYGILIQLLGFDKTYAIENPSHKNISYIYQSHRVDCRYIHMDQNGVLVTELEQSDSDILHISPSHHFPTGIVTPISRRYELLGWASGKEGRYIIEDDYDSEFRLTGKPIPTLQSIDVMEKVIYMNTFTKSLASTIRIGYMVLPVPLINRYYTDMGFYSCTVSNFEQYTLSRFMNRGYFEKHINRMRNYYRLQRDVLLKCIEDSPLSSHVEISEEDAGLHFLLTVKTAMTDSEFIEAAKQKGIHLSSLSHYYLDDNPPVGHTFIINYSYITSDRIEEAVKRLCSLLL